MNIELYYTEIMSVMIPIIKIAGLLALTMALIVMLINILINAATGRGLRF